MTFDLTHLLARRFPHTLRRQAGAFPASSRVEGNFVCFGSCCGCRLADSTKLPNDRSAMSNKALQRLQQTAAPLKRLKAGCGGDPSMSPAPLNTVKLRVGSQRRCALTSPRGSSDPSLLHPPGGGARRGFSKRSCWIFRVCACCRPVTSRRPACTCLGLPQGSQCCAGELSVLQTLASHRGLASPAASH